MSMQVPEPAGPSGGTAVWIQWAISAIVAAAALFLIASPSWGDDVQVAGSVTSSNGPLVDGKVTFFGSCADATGYSAYVTNGSYALSLPPGTYRVQITPYGTPNAVLSWHNAKGSCQDSDPVVVSGASTVDLVATAGGTLTGRVSSSKGPVAHGSVSFYESCADFAANRRAGFALVEGSSYSVTLRQGTYRALVDPAGVYGALKSWHGPATSCDDAATITVTAGGTSNLLINAGQIVTGSVASSNGPILEGGVSFYRSCQDFADGKVAGEALLDAAHYSLVVPSGVYRVLVEPGWAQDAVRSWHRAAETCEEAEVVSVDRDVTVDLMAIALFEIHGRVRTTGRGLGVSAWKSCQQYENDWPNAAASAQIVDGSYALSLPPGSYLFSVAEEYPNSSATSWHPAKPDCQRAVPVVVVGNATVDLEAMPYVTVSGSVSGNGPVDQGAITLWRGECFPNGRSSLSVPISNGRYEMRVPVGGYRIKIIPADSSGIRNYTSWHNAREECEKADRVTIDEDMTLDLKAIPRYTVNGEVVRLGSARLRNAFLYSSCDLFEPPLPGVNAERATVSGNSFEFGVPPGTYRALIESQGAFGFSYAWHSGAGSCEEAVPIVVDRDFAMQLTAIPELTVSGQVNGAPFGGLDLYATCEDFRAGVRAQSSGGSLLFGRFSITVMPGTYRVLINSSEGETERRIWHRGAGDCESATPVVIDSDRSLELSAVIDGNDPAQPGGGAAGPGPIASLAKQTVRAPRMKLKAGARTTLSRRTNAGARVTWRVTSNTTCKKRGYRFSAKRPGVCRLTAWAPAVPGYTAMNKKYRIRVKAK